MRAVRFLAVVALSLAITAPAFAQSASTVRLRSSPNPSRVGRTIKLTADVDGLGGGAPTGAVTFSTATGPLGSAALSPYALGPNTLTAGVFHSCALTAERGIKCWGSNQDGQLGDGTTTDRHSPIYASGFANGAVAVSAGTYHTCALTEAGGVKCWGYNGLGALGDGTNVERHTPVNVSGLSSNVVAISAGLAHTCALTSAGAVKCWGENDDGRLGDGTRSHRYTPVDVVGLSGGVAAISAGGAHTCALTGDGAVKCWGHNGWGQVGDGTHNNMVLIPVTVSGLSGGVAEVDAGSYSTCARTSAGAAKCWGYNGYGQLGDGTRTDRYIPAAVSSLSSGVAALATSFYHSCALTKQGGVKCWGTNQFGALGDGTTTSRLTPVVVSGLANGVVAIAASAYRSSCAIIVSGGVKCWGYNGHGQLGDGTDITRLTPVSTQSLVTLVRARAQFSTMSLKAGSHLLEAIYPGDAKHRGSIGRVAQWVHSARRSDR